MDSIMSKKPSFIVADLVNLLKDIPQDLQVRVEGCDCIGPWSGSIEIDEEDYDVTIKRGEED